MGRPVFACGVVPWVKPGAFSNPNLRRDLPIVPITVLREVCGCVCVCVCVCSPTPSSNLTSLPSFSFLFHTLSAVLTHSSWAGPKSGRAALQSGTPVLKLTQSAAGTLKNPFREPFLFSSVEETWRWFIRRFIVYHSMDYPICSPHTKVTITVFLFLFVCFY